MNKTPLAALRRAITRAGTATRLAEQLGISSQAIGKWQRTGIPPLRVLDVERLTGVRRHDLRPDIYPRGKT